MWFYENVTREEFEKVKDKVQHLMIQEGAKIVKIDLPYESKTTNYTGDNSEEYISNRPVFFFADLYYRIDEVLFAEKPFIVMECGNHEELLENTMEDLEPFPFDLSDDELRKEVRYDLMIEI